MTASASRSIQPHLAVLAANIFFAINFIAVPHLTNGFIAPAAINLLRVGISVLLFWSLLLFKPSYAGIKRKDLPRFLLCALTGVVINQILFIKGLSLTLPIHAALLALGTPIFITFVAAWLDKESLSFLKIIGLALGVGGALILVTGREGSGEAKDIVLGNILVIINAISYAFYFSLVKPLMKEYKPLHVLRWIFTLGLPFMIAFGWSSLTEVDWKQFGELEWASIIMVVVAATFLAYLFNLYGINQLGAGVTGAYIYTQPVFATILSVWLMGEQLTATKIAAAILIFAGVWLVGKKRPVLNPRPA